MIPAVRGTRDILPGEVERWQFVEATARAIFERYGYAELRTPIIEREELFAKGTGETTDIVQKEMYAFTDKGGERVTLRPEATPSIVRAFAEHSLEQAMAVPKLYLFGPMFRYERPQKGRYRQFHQLDVEVFGVEDASIDAEILDLAWTLVQELGIADAEMVVNSVGCPACRPAFAQALVAALGEDAARLCEDCQRRAATNPLRIFDCKVETCQEAIANAPKVTDFICPECQGHFNQVKKYLEMVELPYILNPRMVRGLDYYTRTAFEVVSYQLGSQNAVTGGGRYDNLFQEIGDLDVPGIGFAIGMERLVSLLPKDKEFFQCPHLFVAALGEETIKEAYRIINQLHLQGIRVELDYEGKSLKSQMRRADKLKAEYVLILGEDEMKRGKAALRNMGSKVQEEIALKDIVNTLKEKILRD